MNTNKTRLTLTIIVCAIFIVGVIVVLAGGRNGGYRPPVTATSTATSTATTTATTTSTTTVVIIPKSYTLAEVSQHADSTNCWTTINGSVYNLTDWIAKHPGGEGAILSICGKDGSAAFNNQHGGQGRPERILEQFIIGSLKS